MTQVTIRTRQNGPFLVTGPAQVIDHLGNAFDLAGQDSIALCRCGHSARKPFCDGSHRSCGFAAAETAPPPVQPPAP